MSDKYIWFDNIKHIWGKNMEKNNLLKKSVVFVIIVLFVGAGIVSSISGRSGINNVINAVENITNIISSESDLDTFRTIINNGSLSGYVTDPGMNPIERAMVRVYFHETYEEDYSDSSGYYHVTNIPICYCLKNATASKEGYKTEWVLLSIDEGVEAFTFVLGIGNVDITVNAEAYGEANATKTKTGIIFGPFALI